MWTNPKENLVFSATFNLYATLHYWIEVCRGKLLLRTARPPCYALIFRPSCNEFICAPDNVSVAVFHYGRNCICVCVCFSGHPLRQLLQREPGDWSAERVHSSEAGRHPHYNLWWRLQTGRRRVHDDVMNPTSIYPVASLFEFAVKLL